VVKFWVIGETTQVISRVQGMESQTTFYFSDLFGEEVFSSLIMGFGQTFAREIRFLKKSSLKNSNIVNCKSNPSDFLRH